MGSPGKLFHRQITVHEILGGGVFADVVLWRRRDSSRGIMVLTLFAWLVFERSGYTLLSFLSSVILLLSVILFLWAKSAAILNRPAPPLPEMQLSEEMVNEAAAFIRDHVNELLSIFHDIALARNSRLFFKVATLLFLTYLIGGSTDFPTLCYTIILFLLTFPVLYERYEDHIDSYIMTCYRKMQQLYMKFDSICVDRSRRWVSEDKLY